MTPELARGLRQIAYTLILVAILKGCTLVLDAQELTLRVSPKVGNTPLTVHVTLTVEPHPDNRAVCLIYEGNQFSVSCWEHIGAQAPKTTSKELRALPEGAYALIVEVQRVGGKARVVRDTFCVLGPSTGLEQCYPGGG